MTKAEIEEKAKADAQTAFNNRPGMGYIALENYIMTEVLRAGIPRNGHTTYQSVYRKTYNALCKSRA